MPAGACCRQFLLGPAQVRAATLGDLAGIELSTTVSVTERAAALGFPPQLQFTQTSASPTTAVSSTTRRAPARLLRPSGPDQRGPRQVQLAQGLRRHVGYGIAKL